MHDTHMYYYILRDLLACYLMYGTSEEKGIVWWIIHVTPVLGEMKAGDS